MNTREAVNIHSTKHAGKVAPLLAEAQVLAWQQPNALRLRGNGGHQWAPPAGA